jgi:hypothetical protein
MRPTALTLAAAKSPASLTIAVGLTAVLLAACGGSNKPSSAGSSGSAHGAFTLANAEKYPDCMRAHGVGNFPDPQVKGKTVQIRIDPSITGSPAYASAQQACAYLIPAAVGPDAGLSAAQQQARSAGLLAFAACVRQHGFPSFPDPTRQGQLTVQMIRQAGINLAQPAVRRAGDACVASSRGQITKADVARAIANAGGS